MTRAPRSVSQEGPASRGGEGGLLARFAAVGAVTTLLDIALFAALTAAHLPAGAANLLSYSCGIALSYALNRRWTFAAEGSPGRAVRFVTATLAGLGASTLLVLAFASILPPVVAKALSVPIVFLWNYGASRLWVFRPGTKPHNG